MSAGPNQGPSRPVEPAGFGPATPRVAHPHLARIDLRAGLLLVVLCACWGFQQVVIKLAARHGLPTLTQAGLRSVLATLVLVLWVRWRHGSARWLFAVDAVLAPGAVMGLIFAGEFVLMYWGLQYTTASRGVLFLYTAPFFVALGVQVLVPAERLDPRQAVGLLCAFIGVGVALRQGLGAGGTILGDLMLTGAAALWGALTLMAKVNRRLSATPPVRVLFLQLAGSAPILLAVAAVRGGFAAARPDALAWAALGYQSVLVAFITYLAWYWLILHYPATRVSAFSFLTPLFGMLSGAAVLGEPVSVAFLLALSLVGAGLYLVNGRAREQA